MLSTNMSTYRQTTSQIQSNHPKYIRVKANYSNQPHLEDIQSRYTPTLSPQKSSRNILPSSNLHCQIVVKPTSISSQIPWSSSLS